MARYIDADAALNAIKEAELGCEYEAVEAVPTADVVERKRGKWMSLNGWITCSECGCEPPNETNIESDFCPNCGADMRGETDERL